MCPNFGMADDCVTCLHLQWVVPALLPCCWESVCDLHHTPLPPDLPVRAFCLLCSVTSVAVPCMTLFIVLCVAFVTFVSSLSSSSSHLISSAWQADRMDSLLLWHGMMTENLLSHLQTM